MPFASDSLPRFRTSREPATRPQNAAGAASASSWEREGLPLPTPASFYLAIICYNRVMRVFIGIPASEEIKAKVLEWKTSVGLSTLIPDPSPIGRGALVRWIKPQNLHITLVPPWEERHEAWNIKHVALKQKLRRMAVPLKQFSIIFQKIEFGPDKNQPRMIWVSGTTEKTINDLRLTIYQALGFEAGDRLFRMHMTLARIKHTTPPAIGGSAPSLAGGDKINWQMPVNGFTLYESHLLPQGSEYRVIDEIRF